MHLTHLTSLSAVSLCLAALSSTLLPAQCTPGFMDGGMPSGPYVYGSTMWNGDLVVVGGFSAMGSATASGVASWNFASRTWSDLAGGVSGNPTIGRNVIVLANGDLLVGGDFTTAGSTSANNIAIFDGSTWSALGSGVNSTVLALAQLPNGDIVAGGQFTTAGGNPAEKIARWNGSTWSAFGSGAGPMFSTVIALTVMPNGDLIAGGTFGTMNGVSVNRIARWDGTSWSPLGAGFNELVTSLTVDASGNLWAGGQIWSGGASPTWLWNVGRWNGSAWNTPFLSATGPGEVKGITTLSTGEVVASGWFGALPSRNNVWMFDGSSLTTFGPVPSNGGVAYTIAEVPNNDFVVGGYFDNPSLGVLGVRPFSKCVSSAVSLGVAACPSSVGTHVRVGTTPPQIGTTFFATTDSMPTLSFAFQLVGSATTSVATSTLFPGVGFPGCLVTSNSDIMFNGPFAPFGGLVTCSFAIPNNIGLIGAVVFEQGLMVETDAVGTAIAVTVNEGLALTIGYW